MSVVHGIGRSGTRIAAGVAMAGLALVFLAAPAPAPATSGRVPAGRAGPAAGLLSLAGESPVMEVSKGCAGQNAETETAAGGSRFVYNLWIGCGGIGFARSADGGLHFAKPVRMPGTAGFSWDPAITVAPGGTVYAAYMHQAHGFMYPIVAASFNHGRTFPQVVPLLPRVRHNWGDRDFIAAGPHGELYVTWDYGPSAAAIKLLCRTSGSCAYAAGDVNAVIQKSTDGGKTWGPITPVGPNFPRNGGYSVPLVVARDGQVDVLSWGHYVGPAPGYKLHPGHEFFSSSPDGTHWPARPRELWPGRGPIALPVWWIDGNLAADRGGNLYATWDTQTRAGDIGWLSASSDGGKTWGRPVRVTPDNTHAVHILAAAGGRAGVAYVGWQTDAPAAGYATYLRPYSLAKGWLGPAIKVSPRFGRTKVWPGDTFGIATLPGNRLALSWGSATGHGNGSQIYGTVVTLRP